MLYFSHLGASVKNVTAKIPAVGEFVLAMIFVNLSSVMLYLQGWFVSFIRKRHEVSINLYLKHCQDQDIYWADPLAFWFFYMQRLLKIETRPIWQSIWPAAKGIEDLNYVQSYFTVI